MRKAGVAVVLSAALWISGCGKPPEQEMAQAENVIRDAQQADAHKFARPELANAERLLREARENSAAGDYDIARDRALQANQAAAQAVETAQRNKKIFEENAARRAEEEAARRAAEEEEARRKAEEEAAIREEALKAEMAALQEQPPEAVAEAAPAAEAAPEVVEAPPPPPPVEEAPPPPPPEPKSRRQKAAPVAEYTPPPVQEEAPARSFSSGGTISYSGATRTYTTQRYDTIGKVAKEQLGDSRLWPAIYDLNSAKIPDPDRLPKGVVLEIPTELTYDQKAEARERASSREGNFSLFDGQ